MNFSNKDIVYSPDDYAKAAVVAHEAAKEMLSRLDWMTLQPKMIVDMGRDTGESGAGLRKRYPDASVLTVGADAKTLPLGDQTVDLIFANFVLPWQREIKSLLNEWLRVLSPNGLLMISSLGLDTLQECRDTLSDRMVPALVDMHDVGDALIQTGFSDPVLDVDYYHVTYRDNAQMAHELSASGLWLPGTDHTQIQSFSPNAESIWSLTFEVIYAHTFAPMTSDAFAPEEDGIVKIPLSALRRRLAGAS